MHRITPSQSGFRSYSGGGGRLVLDETDDKKDMQQMKGTGMKGESFAGVEAPQNYGFTSHNMKADKNKNGEILDGAEGYYSYAGGNRSHPVAGAMDDRRHRMKELDEGDTAMYRGKDDRQQFHMNGKGTFLSNREDKKMRIALVPDKREQQQGAQQQNAEGGGGQGEQKKKEKGQKPAKDDNEKSDTFFEQTKDHNHIRRGNGNVKTEDKVTHTYHKDTNTSTRCDDGHCHIRKGAAKIWVSAGGCHSTVPITIVDCKDDGGGEKQWTEGTNPSAPSTPSGTPSGVEFIYPPPDRTVTPYDVSSVSPPLSESGGNVSMAYAAPIGLGTGATPPLTLKYAAPLILDGGGNLTVDPAVLGGGTVDLSGYAPLDSPVFIGNPTAPTPATADNDTSIATTAFVKVQGYITSSALSTYAPLASPTFTGDPKAPTPLTADNDTSIATTAFVKAQGYITSSALSTYAPLASPAFTGSPTAPTPTAGDNDTSIATTAFVQNAISSVGGGNVSNVGTPVSGQLAQWTGATTIQGVDVSSLGYAPLASPTFTGDPKAPTPATADNDTSIATTAFVKAQGYLVSTDLSAYALLASPVFTGDPRAPTPLTADNDTSIATTAFVKAQGYATTSYVDTADALKAPLASPALTGNPTAPTPTAGDNDTSIATTAFVTGAISTAGGGYQPLDADLTALAALTGTNTIYYRSAANTWSPVTIGGNMTFSGGVLDSVAAGGGNVSTTGTPVAGQFAVWTDATHVKGTGSLIKMATLATTYNIVAADFNSIYNVSGTWTLGHTVTAAAAGNGFSYWVRNTGNGTITIDPAGSETIDGASTLLCLAKQQFQVVCDGANWFTLGRQSEVVLSQQTVSGASDVQIQLPPDYISFDIRADVFAVSVAGNLAARIATDGVPNFITTSTYYWAYSFSGGASGSANAQNYALVAVSQLAANAQGLLDMHFYPGAGSLNAHWSARFKVVGVADGTQYVGLTGGTANVSGVRVTHIQFFGSGGGTLSGTFTLIGKTKL
jgi:hypothetical protein